MIFKVTLAEEMGVENMLLRIDSHFGRISYQRGIISQRHVTTKILEATHNVVGMIQDV